MLIYSLAGCVGEGLLLYCCTSRNVSLLHFPYLCIVGASALHDLLLSFRQAFIRCLILFYKYSLAIRSPQFRGAGQGRLIERVSCPYSSCCSRASPFLTLDKNVSFFGHLQMKLAMPCKEFILSVCPRFFLVIETNLRRESPLLVKARQNLKGEEVIQSKTNQQERSSTYPLPPDQQRPGPYSRS